MCLMNCGISLDLDWMPLSIGDYYSGLCLCALDLRRSEEVLNVRGLLVALWLVGFKVALWLVGRAHGPKSLSCGAIVNGLLCCVTFMLCCVSLMNCAHRKIK